MNYMMKFLSILLLLCYVGSSDAAAKKTYVPTAKNRVVYNLDFCQYSVGAFCRYLIDNDEHMSKKSREKRKEWANCLACEIFDERVLASITRQTDRIVCCVKNLADVQPGLFAACITLVLRDIFGGEVLREDTNAFVLALLGKMGQPNNILALKWMFVEVIAHCFLQAWNECDAFMNGYIASVAAQGRSFYAQFINFITNLYQQQEIRHMMYSDFAYCYIMKMRDMAELGERVQTLYQAMILYLDGCDVCVANYVRRHLLRSGMKLYCGLSDYEKTLKELKSWADIQQDFLRQCVGQEASLSRNRLPSRKFLYGNNRLPREIPKDLSEYILLILRSTCNPGSGTLGLAFMQTLRYFFDQGVDK